MQIETHTNKACITLLPGESFNFPPKYFRGKRYGIKGAPPCPFGSPFARLWHGCYWMFEYTASGDGESIALQGPSPTGGFVSIELKSGDRFFANLNHLAGYTSDVRFHTKIRRLFSPTCWIFGHPLPVVVSGPGTVLFYADEGLQWDENTDPHQWGYIPNQVIAFESRATFRAETPEADKNWLSQILNALGDDYRWILPTGCKTLVWGVNRPINRHSHLLRHLIIHGIIFLLAMLLINLPVARIAAFFGR